jgi:hypothetical protein
MSRIRSELNAEELKYFYEIEGAFARRHPQGHQMLETMRREDFHVCQVVEHDYHALIRLGCGAILSVYRSGKVLVQGRAYGCGADEAVSLLRELLPRSTVWQLRVEA